MFMNVHNGVQARLIYSVALPLVFISQLAIIHAFIVTFKLRNPQWFRWLWWVGIGFFIASLLFRNSIYPVLQPVPDGYYFGSPSADIGFSILKTLVYGSTLIGFVCVLWTGLKRQGYKARWVYGLMILV
ncbi:hypothetical protein, partial [Alicyclobacillus acidiphilus]|uniref:hypothetical protein n=1 Tax=Alicyclobacillus acidiphilus TaxID=182455 RepID=UPI001C3F421B